MKKTAKMDSSFTQSSLLSQAIKKKTCLTNKNRKNKNGNIKKFFSESSHSVREKSSVNASGDESLDGLIGEIKPYNDSTGNKTRSSCFDDADNDDSFDLFVPSKFTKLHPAKRTGPLSEEDDSSECAYGSQKSSSYFNDVKSPSSKSDGLKQCPICFSQFSNVQLHLNSCTKKYGLSSEMVSVARSLREKFDSERSKLGLPLLGCSKINLDKFGNNGFDDPVSSNGGSLSVNESCSSTNNIKPAELKWFGKSKKISGNPLLFRRTNQEREKIITEKVAIVLMASGSKDEFPKAQITLKSEHLTKQWNEDLILWNKSTKSPESVETSDFYVPQLSSHIEPVKVRLKIQDKNQATSNLESIRDDGLITHPGTTPTDEKPETANLSQCTDYSEPDQSEVESKITEFFQSSLTPCNRRIVNSGKEGREKDILCYDDANKQSVEIFSPLSEKLDDCVKYEKIMSENHSPVIESINKQIEDQVDERYLKTLSSDWDRVFGKADFSDITVLLTEGSTLPVHSIVLSARCHKVLSDVVNDAESKDNHKLLKWPEISFDACFAFFKYIYTADIGHLEKLSGDDFASVKKLSTLYDLTGLKDILSTLLDVGVNYSSSGYSSVSAMSNDNVKLAMNDICSSNANNFCQNNTVTEVLKTENPSDSCSDTLVSDYSGHNDNIHHKHNESSLSVKSEAKRKYSETTSSKDNLDDSFNTKRSKLFCSSESESKGYKEDNDINRRSNSEGDMFTDDYSVHEGEENVAVDHKNVLNDTLIVNAFDNPFDSLERSGNGQRNDNGNIKPEILSLNNDCVSDVNVNDSPFDSTEVDLPTGFDCIGNYSTFSFREGVSSSPNVGFESHSALHKLIPLTECPNNASVDKNKAIRKKSPKTSLDKYFEDDSFPSVNNVLDEIEVRSPGTHLVNLNDNGLQEPKSPMSPNLRLNAVGSTPSPQVIRSDKVTPLPNYSIMISPELKNELRKYGLKPGLDRRKAKLLLRYIYDQIHPVVSELNGYSPRQNEMAHSPSEKLHQAPAGEIYNSVEDNSDAESCKSFISISSCAQSEVKDQD